MNSPLDTATWMQFVDGLRDYMPRTDREALLLILVNRLIETGDGAATVAAGTNASAAALKRFILYLSHHLGLVDEDDRPLVTEKRLRFFFRTQRHPPR